MRHGLGHLGLGLGLAGAKGAASGEGGMTVAPATPVDIGAGAAIWIQSPQAISANSAPVVCAITPSGRLVINAQGISAIDLRGSTFQVDDHAVGTILKRASDSKLLVFACAHNGNGMYTYLSTSADDASAFGPETNISSQLGLSGYSYPSAEQMSNGDIYLFFRASDGSVKHVYVSKSIDGGATWSAATKLLANNGDSADFPPYFRIAGNGAKIGIACNDGAPDTTATNSLYYFEWAADAASDIGGNALSLPITPASDLTAIYDGTTTRSWVADLVIDGTGKPTIAHAVFHSTADIRYRRARYSGASWQEEEICTAGAALYPGQPHYFAGICIDPDDVDTIFCARPDATKINQIYRYSKGASWQGIQMTGQTTGAMRPQIVRGQVAEPRLGYQAGQYNAFTDFLVDSWLLDSTGGATTTDTGLTIGGSGDSHWGNVVYLVDFQQDGLTTTFSDQSASAHTAAATGAECFCVNGKLQNAGNSSYASTAYSSDFIFDGDFTVEIAGVEVKDLSLQNGIVSVYDTNSKRSWNMTYEGSLSPKRWRAVLSGNGTSTTIIDGNQTVTAGAEHYVTLERSGTTVRIYVDGTMLASGTFSGSTFDTSNIPLLIGKMSNAASTTTIDGRIRGVRITKGVARYANDGGHVVPDAWPTAA